MNIYCNKYIIYLYYTEEPILYNYIQETPTKCPYYYKTQNTEQLHIPNY